MCQRILEITWTSKGDTETLLDVHPLSVAVFQNYASTPSLTPDDDVFKHLALTYSSNHPVMSRGVACKAGTPAFSRGITNGAEWYPLTGKPRGLRATKSDDISNPRNSWLAASSYLSIE